MLPSSSFCFHAAMTVSLFPERTAFSAFSTTILLPLRIREATSEQSLPATCPVASM